MLNTCCTSSRYSEYGLFSMRNVGHLKCFILPRTKEVVPATGLLLFNRVYIGRMTLKGLGLSHGRFSEAEARAIHAESLRYNPGSNSKS
jgi:hypothetical protein